MIMYSIVKVKKIRKECMIELNDLEQVIVGLFAVRWVKNCGLQQKP